MTQTDFGNKYALTALRTQRGKLAGEIADLKTRLKWAEGQLVHVDACLRLMDPETDPTKLPAVRVYRRVKLFRQGELGRMIIDALRRAGKPLGTHQITMALLEAGGHTEAARPSLTPRVRGNLAYLERGGKVTKSGTGKSVLWSLQ